MEPRGINILVAKGLLHNNFKSKVKILEGWSTATVIDNLCWCLL